MSPAGTRLSLTDGPFGGLEWLTTGRGEPSTVFAHGLAGSIASTRPFAGEVHGRRTFFHFRGHGASCAPESAWTYQALARELDHVARLVGATRALGVSMGAGALCSLLETQPDRFERLVMVIPAVIDRPRTDRALHRLLELGDAVETRDHDAIVALLLDEQPAPLRTTAPLRTWAEEQARLLIGTPVAKALHTLPLAVPMHDRASLGAVKAPVLIVAQDDDPAHPLHIAEELAAALPHATVETLPTGGILWSHRAQVRRLIGEFLNG